MTTSPLSVQLYTVREALQSDLTGTLRRLADLGFGQVEPYAFTDFPGLAAALTKAGLTAPTTHAHVLGESDERATEIFQAARDAGINVVIDPFTEPERWQTEAGVREVAEQANRAAGLADAVGVRFGYHNHAHELESLIGGRPALEVFADLLDPAVVLEVDTYWVAVGGQDPVELLRRLGDRVVAIHVKDGPGTAETKDQVAVGSGALPIRRILEAAPNALRVIELDDSRGDRFQAVADSLGYLKAEGLA